MFKPATNANQKMRAWTPDTDPLDPYVMWVTKKPFLFESDTRICDFTNLLKPAIITHYLNEFDCDKKEICEGDILLCDTNGDDFFLIVVGIGGEISLRTEDYDITLLKWTKNIINNKQIVGNVFQHPTVMGSYYDVLSKKPESYFSQETLLDLVDEAKQIDLLTNNVSRSAVSDEYKPLLADAYSFLNQTQIDWVNASVFRDTECNDFSISNFPCTKIPTRAISETYPVEVYYCEIDDNDLPQPYEGFATETLVSIKLAEDRFLCFSQACFCSEEN